MNVSDYISIITAVITGVYIVFLIQLMQVENEVETRYVGFMKPFFHKLTNYAIFARYMKSCIKVTNKDGEYVKDFFDCLGCTDEIAHKSITTGNDVPIGYYTAKRLDHLCEDLIGNVWYYLCEKGQYLRCDISFDRQHAENFTRDIVKEYLTEVNPMYADSELTLGFLAEVAGDFYVKTYREIHNYPFQYETWNKKRKQFRNWLYGGMILSVLSVLSVLVFGNMLCAYIVIAITLVNIAFGAYVLKKFLTIVEQGKKIIR